MILLISSCSFKLLRGFLIGSLTSLAVILKNYVFKSKLSFIKDIQQFTISFCKKKEFYLRNVVFKITAKLVKDPLRNPLSSLKEQEEISNIIIY